MLKLNPWMMNYQDNKFLKLKNTNYSNTVNNLFGKYAVAINSHVVFVIGKMVSSNISDEIVSAFNEAIRSPRARS